jgi:serine/threonine-protein kinase
MPAPMMAHVSTGGSALLGTWDYMAPEQWIKSKTADAKADVYSLGVLVFQMLAGRLPFVAEDAKALMALHLFEDPPMKRLRDEVPRDLRGLVERMLHKLPKSRPTMHEVVEQIEAMQSKQG